METTAKQSNALELTLGKLTMVLKSEIEESRIKFSRLNWYKRLFKIGVTTFKNNTGLFSLMVGSNMDKPNPMKMSIFGLRAYQNNSQNDVILIVI